MHPNGQLPAYEWAFGDVNPPVHAWAAWRVFQIDRRQRGDQRRPGFPGARLPQAAAELHLVGQSQGRRGRNIFQGGFLGWTTSASSTAASRCRPAATSTRPTAPLDGDVLPEHDAHRPGTGAARSGLRRHRHQVLRAFPAIAEAMTNIGEPTASACGTRTTGSTTTSSNLPDGESSAAEGALDGRADSAVRGRDAEPELLDTLAGASTAGWNGFSSIGPTWPGWSRAGTSPGRGERRLLSLLRGHRMKCLLRRMLDETEFLSDYGVRALSQVHQTHPYVFRMRRPHLHGGLRAGRIDVAACSAATRTGAGRSGFRSITCSIESLQKFHHYYGDDFKVECPTGSGKSMLTLREVADELTRRLVRIFLRDAAGATAGVWRMRKAADRPAFPRSICCSTNTSTATPAAGSAPRIRPAGPAWWPGYCNRDRPIQPHASAIATRPDEAAGS